MPMHITQQKEQFSRAYVKAVATVAGYSLSYPDVDDDSIDVSISETGGNGSIRSPRIDVQLKCTSGEAVNNGTVSLHLKMKNYNDLRPSNVLVPRILIIIVVPNNVENWLDQTEEKLSLYHCGYWHSLRGAEESENEENITISFPSSQVFTKDQLQSMMTRIGSGGLP